MWRISHSLGLSLGILASTLMAQAGAAQTYPEHPVKIVISFAPGGGADLTARTIARALQDRLGKPFIVENKPGGSAGSLGVETVVRAAPDGYTLLVTPNGPMVIGPHLDKLPYDILKDLAPVGMAAFAGSAIAVPASLPVHNVADLVRYSKEKSGGLSYSHPGPGNQMQLAGELLKSMSGANLVGVAYKGNGPAVNALLQGEVQVGISDLVSLLPHVKAGKIRLIAVTNKTRQAIVPDVPTVAESGYPDYSADAWVGMFAPAATPAPIVDVLNQELARAMKTSEVTSTFGNLGMQTTAMSPAEMRTFVTADYQRWGGVIKSLDLKNN